MTPWAFPRLLTRAAQMRAHPCADAEACVGRLAEEKPTASSYRPPMPGKISAAGSSNVAKGKLQFLLAHNRARQLIAVETKEKSSPQCRWNPRVATYDGSGKAAGVILYMTHRQNSRR